MELYQLVYYSRNTIYGDNDVYLANVNQILAKARINNTKKDVTGFLFADRSWFFQVLEGSKDALAETLNIIYADKRHTGITIIQNRVIQNRSFLNWTMGCSVRTPEKYGIFCRHGFTAQFDPRKINAETIVALAYDLSNYENNNQKILEKATNHLNDALSTKPLIRHL